MCGIAAIGMSYIYMLWAIKVEIMKNILVILFLFPILSFGQNLIGNYEYKLNFEGTPIYRDFKLELKSDSTFIMSKYVFESCYDYTDTLTGKWKVANANLSFYDIDQPKYISKSIDTNIQENEIIVKEKCVFSYMSKDSSGIKLLVLDSKFKPIEYLNPEQYLYEDEAITTKYKLPKEAYQIVYYNGRAKPLDGYFYGGITLVGFDKKNNFEISNCGMSNDTPVKFLNPFIQFRIENDGSLKSLKKFREIDGKNRFRIFKKSP
jgi:hypothetical protein